MTSTAPTLTWVTVAEASRYVLYVEYVSDGSVVVREDFLTESSFTPSSTLGAGTYRVWVKAINGATGLFTDGLWSQSFDFNVA